VRCDGTEVLNLVKETLDEIALAIERKIAFVPVLASLGGMTAVTGGAGFVEGASSAYSIMSITPREILKSPFLI
jgi:hypothetical protein